MGPSLEGCTELGAFSPGGSFRKQGTLIYSTLNSGILSIRKDPKIIRYP